MFKTKISYSILSAVLLVLSFPPLKFNFFAFFAFSFFIIAIENESYNKTIILSLIHSFFFFIGILYWIYVYNIIALPGIILIMSIYNLIASLTYKFISNRLYKIEVFIFPFIFTMIEFIKSNGYWGFPWGNIAYTQTGFLQLIQISDIIGVFGVSFFIYLVNSCIAYLILSKFLSNRIIFSSLFVLILFFVIILYGSDKIENINQKLKDKMNTNVLRIGYIQPNLNPYLEWKKNKLEIKKIISKNLFKLSLKNPDLIVLPETVINDYVLKLKNNKFEWDDFEWKFILTKSLLQGKIKLLLGLPSYKVINNKVNYFNSSFLMNNYGEILNYYNKIHLVPFGETVPFYDKYEFVKSFADKLECSNFNKGQKIVIFDLKKNIKFGSIICYESLFGNLCRRFVKKGSDFFVNITNDAWTKSDLAHKQMASMSIFTAVENSVPLVRVGNSGISMLINNYGKVFNATNSFTFEKGIFSVKINKYIEKTFYSRYGDAFAKIIIIISIILLFVSFFFVKKEQDFY